MSAPRPASRCAKNSTPRAAGLVTYGEQDYPPALPSQSDKTRDQTVAELREARLRGQMKSGELDYPPAVN